MKKTEKLLEIIGEIDLKYVDDAEKAVENKFQISDEAPVVTFGDVPEEVEPAQNVTYKKNFFMSRFLPVAACFLFAVIGIIVIITFSKDENTNISPSEIISEKTVTTTAENGSVNEGTTTTSLEDGIEINTTTVETVELPPDPDLPLLDVQEAEVGRPFIAGFNEEDVQSYLLALSEEFTDKMPVYRNPVTYEDGTPTKGLNYAQMSELLEFYAEKMEINIITDNIIVNYDNYGEGDRTPNRLDYSEPGVASISVDLNGTVSIGLSRDTIPLDNMLCIYESYWTEDGTFYFTKEMMNAVANEVYEKTSPLFVDAMTNPELSPRYRSISQSDIDNEMNRREIEYRVIETGEPSNVFSSCHLDSVFFFSIAGDGDLESMTKNVATIMLFHKINPVKIGDYPTITEEAAEELLRSGYFIGQESFPSADDELVAVKLNYSDSEQTYYTTMPDGSFRTYGQHDEYLLPYYCFTYKKTMGDDGILYYYNYYVPAIKKSYFTSYEFFKR